MTTIDSITDQLIYFFKTTVVFPPGELAAVAGKVLILVTLVTLCLILIKTTTRVLHKLLAGRLPGALFQWVLSAAKWLILAGTLLLIFQQLGIRLNSLWALVSTLLAMVAIGFVALWSVLSNLLCTLMLVIFHPFRIGDEIEIIDPAMTQGVGGRVRNINLIFTVVDAPAGENQGGDQGKEITLHIPNNLFFQKILRRKKGRQTHGLGEQVFEENSLLRQNSRSGTHR